MGVHVLTHVWVHVDSTLAHAGVVHSGVPSIKFRLGQQQGSYLLTYCCTTTHTILVLVVGKMNHIFFLVHLVGGGWQLVLSQKCQWFL